MDSPAFREAMARRVPGGRRRAGPTRSAAALPHHHGRLAGPGRRPAARRGRPRAEDLPYTSQPRARSPSACRSSSPPACPLDGYVTGVAGPQPRGPADQDRGQPDHPRSLGGIGVDRPGLAPRPVRPGPVAAVTKSGRPDQLRARPSPTLRKQLYDTAARARRARLRILTGDVTSPTLAAQITELLDGRPRSQVGAVRAVRPGQRPRRGPAWPSASRVNVIYDFTKADGSCRSTRTSSVPARATSATPATSTSRRGRRRSSPPGRRDGTSRRPSEHEPALRRRVDADHHRGGRRPPAAADAGARSEAFARALAADLGVPGRAPRRHAAGRRPRSGSTPLANDLQATQGQVRRRRRRPPAAARPRPRPRHQRALGNIGKTVLVTAPVEVRPRRQGRSTCKALVEEMAGEDGRRAAHPRRHEPGLHRPGRRDVRRRASRTSVPSFHLGSHQDETARAVRMARQRGPLPRRRGATVAATTARSASAAAAHRAAATAGKSAIELLGRCQRRPAEPRGLRDRPRRPGRTGSAIPKQTGEFEAFWQEAVRSGVVPGTAPPRRPRSTVAGNGLGPPADGRRPGRRRTKSTSAPTRRSTTAGSPTTAGCRKCPSRSPSMTWDNAVFVGPETAQEVAGVMTGLRGGPAGEHGRMEVDVVELEFKGRKIKAQCGSCRATPTTRSPCTSATAATGGPVGIASYGQHGRTERRRQAVRGFNAYAIRTTDALGRRRPEGRRDARQLLPRLHPGPLVDGAEGPAQPARSASRDPVR